MSKKTEKKEVVKREPEAPKLPEKLRSIQKVIERSEMQNASVFFSLLGAWIDQHKLKEKDARTLLDKFCTEKGVFITEKDIVKATLQLKTGLKVQAIRERGKRFNLEVIDKAGNIAKIWVIKSDEGYQYGAGDFIVGTIWI